MNFKGKVTHISDLKSGADWKKVEVVVSTEEQYPQSALFVILSKEVNQIGFKAENFINSVQVGQEIEIEFNFKSSEYKGRYYNDLQCWKWNIINPKPF